MEEKLLRLSIPIRPELALAFVDFATRQLERDCLVWLAGEEKILDQKRKEEEDDKSGEDEKMGKMEEEVEKEKEEEEV